MTLNEVIKYAENNNIDFNKDILCVGKFYDEIILDSPAKIAVREFDEGNKLVLIPFEHAYNLKMNDEFKNVVDSIDLGDKE